jgi:hypothetical protein
MRIRGIVTHKSIGGRGGETRSRGKSRARTSERDFRRPFDRDGRTLFDDKRDLDF